MKTPGAVKQQQDIGSKFSIHIYIYIELQIKEMMEFNAGFLTDVFQNFRGDYWIITLL